ncbi:hypothetical protein ElP_76790 (plasmid) [Tautonia plasticadhaerens]|uniref:Glycosyl transferases group 1 n=2 Tax=Tautonia plasticadhaerens TaxID=2527974 RepID=A0A518HFY9_9BACT|nr:hypothetical protein ElP_76790 [Tautonia plasticadhaerens]
MNGPLDPDDGARFVAVHDAIYESLRAVCDRVAGMREESRLIAAEITAGFAINFHTGRFADGFLERMILEVGERLPSASGSSNGPTVLSSKRRILHVVTEAFGIGGMTRTLDNWVRADRASTHHLYMTAQPDGSTPRCLVEAIARSGGSLMECPRNATRLERGGHLRACARSQADLVVLHHGGHDILPTLAFAGRGGPPVAVLNHADHAFWLGSSVTDLVINQRDLSQRLADRRQTPLNVTLPIPLEPPPILSREAARRRLGIPADTFVLLSVGRAIKFRPTARQNFLRTARLLLERLPSAHLIVVGLTSLEAQGHLDETLHERIHCVGPVEEPSPYRAAADLFLEPFPFGSATSVLESCLAGLPVVLPHSPLLDLLVTNHGIETLAPNPASEEDYVEAVCRLAELPDERRHLAASLQQRVRECHTGVAWLDRLEAVYRKAFSTTHAVRMITPTLSERADTDVRLAYWHRFLRASTADPLGLANRYLLQAAYGARQAGDHRSALRMLLSWHPAGSGQLFRQRMAAAAKVPAHWLWRKAGALT